MRVARDPKSSSLPGVFLRIWYPIAETSVGRERVLYIMEVEERLRRNGVPGFGVRIPPRLNIEREIDEFSDWECSARRQDL